MARWNSPRLAGETRCRLVLSRRPTCPPVSRSRISPEGGDVLPDPPERRALIGEPIVAGRGIVRVLELRARERGSRGGQAGSSARRQRRLAPPRIAARHSRESSRWPPGSRPCGARRGPGAGRPACRGRGPDVECQAVLHALNGAGVDVELRALAQHRRIQRDRRPRRARLRGTPSKIPGWGCRIGDGQVCAGGAAKGALDIAIRRGHAARRGLRVEGARVRSPEKGGDGTKSGRAPHHDEQMGLDGVELHALIDGRRPYGGNGHERASAGAS